MTLGVAYFTLFLTSPAAEAADPRPVTVLIPFALMHIGYVVGPLMIGRSVWASFFAALILGPILLGWLTNFKPWPGDPVWMALAVVSLVVILGLYGLILRHLWVDFQTNRSGGRPKD